ncbi:hypothetical protein NQ314_015856 [Rhamnusium bicolor]|uniref:Uncharacterized protein n=1 Tax=Rhamnusium bicolor TaxID=1586634 RepID=A0AAV8WYA7_9CUCU|nr:hypothetical protein NQ314_015856 [Rhamnusium bicolor]
MYKAKTTRTGVIEPRLWYEPYILIASISVFLLYFTVIREENDIDEELQISLYSRIAGLEEHQLRASLEYNRHHGLETEGIIKRLKEIEKEKNEANIKINVVKTLMSSELVEGVQIAECDKKCKENINCEVCLEGKIRIKFPKESKN